MQRIKYNPRNETTTIKYIVINSNALLANEVGDDESFHVIQMVFFFVMLSRDIYFNWINIYEENRTANKQSNLIL